MVTVLVGGEEAMPDLVEIFFDCRGNMFGDLAVGLGKAGATEPGRARISCRTMTWPSQ